MGKNLQKQYQFRANDIIIKKIDYIAKQNTRNRNQQIEHLLKECISNYETENGELTIEEDGTVHPKKLNTNDKMGKSSSLKTG
jgi:hypothetical protein